MCNFGKNFWQSMPNCIILSKNGESVSKSRDMGLAEVLTKRHPDLMGPLESLSLPLKPRGQDYG